MIINFFRKLKVLIDVLALVLFSLIEILFLFDFETTTRKIIMLLMTLACVVSWYIVSRIFYRFYLILLVLIFVIIYPINIVYGRLSVDFFIAFAHSNTSEAFSYIKQVPKLTWAVMLLQLALFFFLWNARFISDKLRIEKKKIIILFPFLFLLLQIGLSFRMYHLKRNDYNKFEENSYFSFLPVTKVAFFLDYKLNHVQLYLKTEDSLMSIIGERKAVIADRDPLDKSIYVVVIGESVSSNFMQSYGFDSVKNTPFISGSANIQFDHYIAPATTTIPALSNILMFKNNFNKFETIFDELRRHKDVNIAWISNQWKVGMYGNLISILASQTDTQVYVGKYAQDLNGDQETVNILKQMEKNKPYKVVFLHWMGSHPDACSRTGGKYSVFFETKKMSCYVESILQTDRILQGLDDYLRKNFESYKLMYFSDHGMEEINGNMVHGQTGVAHQAPLLIWTDSQKTKKHITAYRTGLDFKYLWNEFFNLNADALTSKYQFIGNDTTGHEIEMINANNQLVPFSLH